MRIISHKPAARGVSQLMYVGDAEPPRTAPSILTIAVVAAIAWVVLRR